ncbi:hypothetical protein RHMOL_Rhmol02G0088400 [Rhododendron molle]|uniref:Uncharacterized protein n=1 Tax=Rhododendron molle TaxID=49168 RepID=A0ACC0PPE7_RHOML|nr:hypothetical protein RHMOL_Rhmol02G0088400 [Rhododendron molle]
MNLKRLGKLNIKDIYQHLSLDSSFLRLLPTLKVEEIQDDKEFQEFQSTIHTMMNAFWLLLVFRFLVM